LAAHWRELFGAVAASSAIGRLRVAVVAFGDGVRRRAGRHLNPSIAWSSASSADSSTATPIGTIGTIGGATEVRAVARAVELRAEVTTEVRAVVRTVEVAATVEVPRAAVGPA